MAERKDTSKQDMMEGSGNRFISLDFSHQTHYDLACHQGIKDEERAR
jgi:hypothetical protein